MLESILKNKKLLIAVAVVIVARWVYKYAISARQQLAIKADVETSELSNDFNYDGLAARMYNAMKGFLSNGDDVISSWTTYNSLTDEGFKHVYNLFNREYSDNGETLRNWISEEWVFGIYLNNPRNAIISRMDQLGLA